MAGEWPQIEGSWRNYIVPRLYKLAGKCRECRARAMDDTIRG